MFCQSRSIRGDVESTRSSHRGSERSDQIHQGSCIGWDSVFHQQKWNGQSRRAKQTQADQLSHSI